MIWNGIIREFREFLPKVKDDCIVHFSEGNTPLIEALNMGDVFGRGLKIFLKYEGLNPTGSFKDRGMTMAVSK
ncbi:MAG: pyridoxal-phosphate dependent enzyme, partial [Deltaproteobacteria bacterium]